MPAPKQRTTVVVISNQAWAVWKFRARLIETLRAAGHQVVVLARRDDAFAKLAPLCDELIHVEMALRRISPLKDLKTLLDYWLLLRRLDPLAVLTFSIKPNIYASLACRWLGVPVVNNVSGLGAIQQRGGWIARTVRWLYRKAFKKSRRVFFQNAEDMRQMLDQSLVVPAQAALLPGSGVDVRYFAPSLRSPGPGPVRFCMIARLLRDKGVVEFAQAAGLLHGRGLPVQFDLWGILDEDNPQCVTRAEIGSWEARGWLAFHGEAGDAREAFEHADVVVLPSFYPEGTPRTLLEGASMALPCITTDMPGCRDAVVDQVTGFVCRARDVDALAAAMARVVEIGAAARQEMGAQGRAYVVAKYDEEIVLAAYRLQLEQIATAGATG